MKIKVWDIPAFWPRDLERPKIGDIVDVDDGLGHGMIACECGRQVKPAASPESAARRQDETSLAPARASAEAPEARRRERAVMARPQPK